MYIYMIQNPSVKKNKEQSAFGQKSAQERAFTYLVAKPKTFTALIMVQQLIEVAASQSLFGIGLCSLALDATSNDTSVSQSPSWIVDKLLSNLICVFVSFFCLLRRGLNLEFKAVLMLSVVFMLLSSKKPGFFSLSIDFP